MNLGEFYLKVGKSAPRHIECPQVNKLDRRKFKPKYLYVFGRLKIQKVTGHAQIKAFIFELGFSKC